MRPISHLQILARILGALLVSAFIIFIGSWLISTMLDGLSLSIRLVAYAVLALVALKAGAESFRG